MAFAVRVADNPDTLPFKVQRLHPDPSQRTRHSPGHIPAMINSLGTDAAGAVTPAGASLTIP